jgi:hypothetical protein
MNEWQFPPLPPPRGRRTHSAHRDADDAMAAAHNLVRLLNGIPFGFNMGIFSRFGAYLLISYPSEGYSK